MPKKKCEDLINGVCGKENCTICYDKSFSSHEKVIWWSNKNTVKPFQLSKFSHVKIWFNCEKCQHEFLVSLSHVMGGCWCNYCGKHMLCDKEDCEICYNKSFASHPKSIYWSDKNKIFPRKVLSYSHKSYIFNCDICNHEFSKIIFTITSQKQWCPYCKNKKLCNDINCLLCYKKSFASNHLSKHWSKTNNIMPRLVFSATATRYSFNCPDCNNTFKIGLNTITCYGCWCPLCKRKSEKKLFNWLKTNFPFLKIIYQASYNWSINNLTSRKLRFDFAIDEINTIIELDGDQHYRQISNWKSPIFLQKRDRIKEKMAEENDYAVFRFLEKNVRKNSDNWDEKMKLLIHQRIQESLNNKGFNVITNFKYINQKFIGYILTNVDIINISKEILFTST